MLSAMSELIAWHIVFLLFNAEECLALCGTEEEAFSEAAVALGLVLVLSNGLHQSGLGSFRLLSILNMLMARLWPGKT